MMEVAINGPTLSITRVNATKEEMENFKVTKNVYKRKK